MVGCFCASFDHRSWLIKEPGSSSISGVIIIDYRHHQHSGCLPSSSGCLSKHQSFSSNCNCFQSFPLPCSLLSSSLILPSETRSHIFSERGNFHHGHHQRCNRCHRCCIYFSPSSRDSYIKHSASSLQKPLHYISNSKSSSQPYIMTFGCTSKLMMNPGIHCCCRWVGACMPNACVCICARSTGRSFSFFFFFFRDQWFSVKVSVSGAAINHFYSPPRDTHKHTYTLRWYFWWIKHAADNFFSL